MKSKIPASKDHFVDSLIALSTINFPLASKLDVHPANTNTKATIPKTFKNFFQ